MNSSQEVETYISKTSIAQQEILTSLRNIILEQDDVSEAIKWGFPVFAKESMDFAYLRTAKDHITLGFYSINKLIDPDNLLQGKGNTLKHIKLKSVDDINAPLIREWLQQITKELA